MEISIIYNASSYLSENGIKNLDIIDKKSVEIIFIIQKNDEKIFDSFNNIKFKNALKKIFVVSSDEGPAYAYNLGINESKYDFVMFASPNITFLPNFEETINKISSENFDLAFFNGLKDGNEATFKESFRYQVVTIWNLIIDKKMLLNNQLFMENYTKLFFDFIYKLLKISSKIIIKKHPLVVTNEDEISDFNSYDILLDATKIFHKIEHLKDLNDKEYYQALASIMAIHKFLKEMKKQNKNDVLKYAIKNANIVIKNIYPNYKNNKFLIKWKNEKEPKFVLNFEPSLKYCLREL